MSPTHPPPSSPTRLYRWLDRLGPGQALALSVALVLAIGALDGVTGYEFSLGALYVAPALLCSWRAGRRAGWAIAVLSAALAVAIMVAQGKPVSSYAVTLWSFATRALLGGVLVELTSHLADAFATVSRLARRDHLSGLANRFALYEVAEVELARSRRDGAPLALLYLDCDGFKGVNDTLGHQAGDQVLRAVGAALRGAVRATDLAARIGGDEFAVLLPAVGPEEAEPLVRRIIAALDDAMRAGGWPVTFSVGAAWVLAPPDSVDALIAQADALMYQAKTHGKNQLVAASVGAPV
jgi:diguanylate cyclase (GGDEF)-like protein